MEKSNELMALFVSHQEKLIGLFSLAMVVFLIIVVLGISMKMSWVMVATQRKRKRSLKKIRFMHKQAENQTAVVSREIREIRNKEEIEDTDEKDLMFLERKLIRLTERPVEIVGFDSNGIPTLASTVNGYEFIA